MPIEKFQLVGKVLRVLVANQYESHISTRAEKVRFIAGDGVQHDNHFGPKLLDVRDTIALRFGLPKGMECFNTRQWSAVSQEELDATAKLMEIECIEYGLLGENIVIEGIPNFSRLPIGTQLFFKGPDEKIRSTCLFVSGENGPCKIPGDAIQKKNVTRHGLSAAFVKHAKHRRGIVGFVYTSGFIKEGDTVVVEIPTQEYYEPPS